MTSKKDIRWEQRFSNYNKALKKLSEAIGYVKNKPKEEVLDEILKEGIIQSVFSNYSNIEDPDLLNISIILHNQIKQLF